MRYLRRRRWGENPTWVDRISWPIMALVIWVTVILAAGILL